MNSVFWEFINSIYFFAKISVKKSDRIAQILQKFVWSHTDISSWNSILRILVVLRMQFIIGARKTLENHSSVWAKIQKNDICLELREVGTDLQFRWSTRIWRTTKIQLSYFCYFVLLSKMLFFEIWDTPRRRFLDDGDFCIRWLGYFCVTKLVFNKKLSRNSLKKLRR